MKKSVDIFYVHLFNDFSGSPRVFRDAINSGISTPNNTYVLTSKHRGFLDGVNARRINCFYARSNNRYIQLFYFLISQIFLFFQLSFWLIGNRLKSRKSTVIINTMLPFGAGVAAKLFATKVVYYVHETHIKPDLLKAFLRFFIQHCATSVIFVSKYLQHQESFDKIGSDVIYNGLRTDFIPSNDLDFRSKFERKQLFFAGSLKKYKGISQLISLALSLPKFNVVAAINCESYEYDEFIAGNTIPKNLIIHVRPSNIQQLFQESFLVLNLSLPEAWTETFGLSLLEGMAFGCPVVAPTVGGPVEFVNNENGLLVDARNTEKIVEFVLYLNSSFDVWNRYSNEALSMSKKFTAEEYKMALIAYFEKFDLV
ncbi:glycosyltransferase family 4 protein [Shewanella sp. Arc9-LZ]|uniref:glycosyltransferase family 4 protein n=1 Tax=Shewanella sp. Arc9-LZ TaxID=2698686 RepID=UPI00137C2339|nr:glycosyltransferase family 4 protein [Shewanella sp. Arc9-LZ]QHS14360.1 glycosyltransferase family 4 protein [Shewanella sp. Arc9-LZ]